MKSKTSFFDQATLRLDLTRFFPVWGLYTAILVSIILLAMGGTSDSLGAAQMMADFLSVTVTANFFYALFSAQALFGYLYDSRLCGGLHALPMTRGCHFRTHVLSGLLFSLIPDLIAVLVSLPLVKEGWAVSAWWLLAVSGQYLFFFGFAALCCFCAGNRVGGVACYALGNLLSPLLYWVADSLFLPLMYGVDLSFTLFSLLCPLINLTQTKGIAVTTRKDYTLYSSEGDTYVLDKIVPQRDYFLYLAIYVAIGLLLLFTAYMLYRRRPLERCGELLAVKPLKPVFLILFTLAAGCFLQLVFDIFLGSDHSYLPLFIGIAVGYFACRMLMERQVKVFRPKALPPLAAIAAVLLLGLTLTSLDVFHVTRRIPEAEDIASVEFTPISEFGTGMTLTNPEAIADFREIHGLQVKRWEDWRKEQSLGGLLNTTTYLPTGNNYTVRTDILYTLKDGSTLVRTYSIPIMSSPETHEAATVVGEPETVPEAEYRETQEGMLLRKYLSTMENTLGISESEIPAYSSQLLRIWFYAADSYEGQLLLTDPQPLLEAIARDCEAGLLLPSCYLPWGDNCLGFLEIQEERHIRDIPIYASYASTAQCLRDMGLLAEE